MLSGTTVTDACRLWVVAFAIPVYGAGSGRAIRGMFAKPTMVYGFGLALICSITCDAMLVAAAFVSDRFAKPIPSMKACRRNTETPANSAMPTSSSTNVKPPSRRAGGIGPRRVCTRCLRARIVFMNESPTLSPACRPARQVSMPRLTGCDSPLRATKSAEPPLKDPALLVTSEPSSATRLTLRVPWLCVPELLRVCPFGRTCRYVVDLIIENGPHPVNPRRRSTEGLPQTSGALRAIFGRTCGHPDAVFTSTAGHREWSAPPRGGPARGPPRRSCGAAGAPGRRTRPRRRRRRDRGRAGARGGPAPRRAAPSGSPRSDSAPRRGRSVRRRRPRGGARTDRGSSPRPRYVRESPEGAARCARTDTRREPRRQDLRCRTAAGRREDRGGRPRPPRRLPRAPDRASRDPAARPRRGRPHAAPRPRGTRRRRDPHPPWRRPG